MTKCQKCKQKYPDHLVQPLISPPEPPRLLCAICALRTRNEKCGLPAGTPFQGEMAVEMYEETVEYNARR